MIGQIKMTDVTCFPKDEDFILSTDKRVNLIYGLNGTGKSTIVRYLQNEGGKDFNKCQLIEIRSGSYEKLVYDREFVRN